jgi:molybdenum cofactor cytidylyltransferase
LNQSLIPSPKSLITAIFLAAGTSSRYGNGINKLLLPFDGELVVQRSLRNLIAAGVQRIVVVTGHERDKITEAIGRDAAMLRPYEFQLELCHNPDYREGEMISSIKAGLQYVRNQVPGTLSRTAALIALADQPLLPPQMIRRILQAFEQNCGDIIAPRFQGQRGHPVLLHQRFFDEALALPPGAFLRDLLKAHPEAVTHLQVNTDFILRDVDTPSAYAEAIHVLASAS